MVETYKGFTLDQFQSDAISAIEKGHSVVVSAATGTGKTLIADYIVEQAIKKKWHVIYTAPIKALSNQKFRDFKRDYGDNIGLLTGDVVINPEAPIRIMTTEIYRNMLLDKEPMDDLQYVIFDEIHYLNDPDRGTVWEESIIFSPPHVRFLCLSATIPNYRQFADWIAAIKKHQVDTVHFGKRAVPLSHHMYDIELGLTDIEKLKHSVAQSDFPRYRNRYDRKKKNKPTQIRVPDHRDLVNDLKTRKWLPAIFFVFSRAGVTEKAQECARKFDFTSAQEKEQIITFVNQRIRKEIKQMRSTQIVKQLVTRGVGMHHAGMLPNLKEIVEELFGMGLIRVLYATETFAIGINMPARAVCFQSVQKYDGRSFRYLNTKEYFQMAGRAGRRGIDELGYSLILIDRNKLEIDSLSKVVSEDVEPIESQFSLSYNTVLNLVRSYDKTTRTDILRSNFGYFVTKQSKHQANIMTSLSNYMRRLEALGYIKDQDTLTWKGEFACHIYSHEIAISQLVFNQMHDKLTDEQLLLVLTALAYEFKPMDHFMIKGARIGKVASIIDQDKEVKRAINLLSLKRLYHLVNLWYSGSQFSDLLEVCNLAEGDIIRLFRQMLDLSAQIRHALLVIKHYPDLVGRIERIMKRVDRDLVAVEFS